MSGVLFRDRLHQCLLQVLYPLLERRGDFPQDPQLLTCSCHLINGARSRGFANPDFQRVAMSHQAESWPVAWPDKFEDAIDPGWPSAWNGYFGKNILNADQESYYLFDDYQNDEFSFFPDTSDLNRRGLGLRGTVRGFQWSNVLVEDVLFQLVDIKNIGTYNHSKMIFGIIFNIPGIPTLSISIFL